jgi:hypothetical protein
VDFLNNLDIYKQCKDPSSYNRFLLFNYIQNRRTYGECVFRIKHKLNFSLEILFQMLFPRNIQRVALEIGVETYVGSHVKSALFLIDRYQLNFEVTDTFW